MRKCIKGNWSPFQEAVWFTGDAINNFLCVLPLMEGGWSKGCGGWKGDTEMTHYYTAIPRSTSERQFCKLIIICSSAYWKAVRLSLCITNRGRNWLACTACHWQKMNYQYIIDPTFSIRQNRRKKTSHRKQLTARQPHTTPWCITGETCFGTLGEAAISEVDWQPSHRPTWLHINSTRRREEKWACWQATY